MPVEVTLYNKPLPVFNGVQDVNQIRQSINKLGDAIAQSCMSSTYITSQRILSMRSLVDVLEQYNNLIIANEHKDE